VNISYTAPRSVKTIRWIARIWSALVVAFALWIFIPDSSSSGPIAAVDKFLLSLLGLTLLGLLIAWRWEFAGGIFAIATMIIRKIAWIILKGNWEIGFLFLWIFLLPPALMFIIAWKSENKAKKI